MFEQPRVKLFRNGRYQVVRIPMSSNCRAMKRSCAVTVIIW
jgi:virulence-associated protein VagC